MGVTNTFSSNTLIKSSEMNTNFNDIEGTTIRQYMCVHGESADGSGTANKVLGSWNFDKSKYPAIQEIYFTANMRTNNASYTATVELVNDTDSVVEATLTTTSTDTTNIETSADIESTIPNSEKKYKIRYRSSNASGGTNVDMCYLVIDYNFMTS